MVKNALLTAFLLLAACAGYCTGPVDTVVIASGVMNKAGKCVVIKPANYKKKGKTFPVVYLLHGYSGNYSNWIMKVPALINYASQFETIIVCPDGGYSSWYFDSPIDNSSKYETYITTEVVHFIDSAYKTQPYMFSRAITGLSMGGHGALYLALRHPQVFGAAGSMSGGVDLKESKNRFDISKRIGDTLTAANEWYYRSVVGMVDTIKNISVKINFECGVNDFFIGGNRLLHKKLTDKKVPHDYTERPGEHNWDYWENAVQYQLLYFKNFFAKGNFISGG
jgi:S-formylglutathione hydrolase FrmB